MMLCVLRSISWGMSERFARRGTMKFLKFISTKFRCWCDPIWLRAVFVFRLANTPTSLHGYGSKCSGKLITCGNYVRKSSTQASLSPVTSRFHSRVDLVVSCAASASAMPFGIRLARGLSRREPFMFFPSRPPLFFLSLSLSLSWSPFFPPYLPPSLHPFPFFLLSLSPSSPSFPPYHGKKQ